MNKDSFEAMLENEKEWRRYVVNKLDSMERDYNVFKIKAFTFMGVSTFLMNIAIKFFYKE